MTPRLARSALSLALCSLAIAAAGCRGRLRGTGSPGPAGPATVAATPVAAQHPAVPKPAAKVATAAPVSRRVGDFDARDVPLRLALADARRQHRPCALVFVTSWCSWCRKLERETLADASVRAELAHWYVVRYDADTGEGRAAAEAYGVSGFPTVELFDSTGRDAGHAEGFSEPARFVGKLRAARH